jgi:hypothetical protein
MNYYVNPISETEWIVTREPDVPVRTYDNYPEAEEHCEQLNHG